MVVISFAFLTTLTLLPTELRDPAAVRIEDYGPCGVTCLYLVCEVRGTPVNWNHLCECVGPRGEVVHSFQQLSQAAVQLGMHPLGLHVTQRDLIALPMPAIAHMKYGHGVRSPHFLVVLGATSDAVYCLDPPHGPKVVPWSAFAPGWTGNVLVFANSAEESGRIHRLYTLRWFSLWCLIGGVGVMTLVLAPELIRRAFPGLREYMSRASRFLRGYDNRGGVGPARKSFARVCAALFSVLVGGTVIFVALTEARAFRKPNMYLETPEIDLGELPPGTHHFNLDLENRGSAALSLGGVTSSCSCVVLEAPKTVDPGAKAPLKMILNVAPGAAEANVRIESNDPRRVHRVKVAWFGTQKPRLIPTRIQDFNVPLGDVYERVLRVVYRRAPSGADLELTDFSCEGVDMYLEKDDAEAVVPTSVPATEPAFGEKRLKSRMNPPSDPALINTRCAMRFRQGQNEYSISLPIAVRFVGDLVAQPEQIVFASTDSIVGQQRRITLHCAIPEQDLAILECPDWLNCQIVRRDPQVATLSIEVATSPGAAVKEDTILVGSRNSSHSALRVRVQAIVVEAAQP